MKKVGVIILCLFLCACKVQQLENKDTIKLNNIYMTSSSVSLEVSSVITDLKYKLYKSNKVMATGKVNDKLMIGQLEKNSEYKLIVYNDETSKEQKIKTKDTVILRFGGDTTISEFFGTFTDSYGFNYMWDDVSALTKGADYTVVNLETSVSERGESTKKEGFGFRSNPKHLQGYVNAGIDMVTLANNHVLDYGSLAFADTLTNLDDYKIKYVGAGSNYETASAVKYVTIKGVKLGFFDATSIIPTNSWIATTDNGGVMPLTVDYYERIYKIIESADKECDMLIVLFHWGTEYTNTPTTSQVTLAHNIIDHGADVIVGGHPHVLQGIEYYNDAQIFYSIGNFIFYKNNDDAALTGLFEIEVDNSKIVSSRVYPVYINKCKANLLDSGDPLYKGIISNLNSRFQGFNAMITNEGVISKK